ncbi:MAG: GtrA family protein [Candidatus Saccharimonadales bacterium]
MGKQNYDLAKVFTRITSNEKIRFVLVGIVNTVVDFGVLLILTSLFGVPKVVANIASTTCALIVSYLLNKKAVFNNTDPNNLRQFLLFLAVTLSSIWILQNIIIIVVSGWLTSLPEIIALIVAKLIATVASLVWNYVWYSKVIFRRDNNEKNQ